jgi:Holliday junction resolvase RusA-like endonuclease
MPRRNDTASPESVQSISFMIYGEPASKANSRRVVRYNNLSRVIKSQKALAYSDQFRQQCVPLDPLMDGDLVMTIHIWYGSRRPDLDDSLILDLMQGVIYKNDRQVKERHLYWHLDKDNPRSYITIEKKAPGVSRGNVDTHPQE